MLTDVLAAPRRLRLGLVLALIIIIAAVLYALAYADPYVGLIMLPFFALGCARGKRPTTLLALSLIPALALLAGSWTKFYLTGMPLVTYDHHFLRQNALMLMYNDWRVAAAAIAATAAVLLYIKYLFAGQGPFSRFEKAGLVALSIVSITAVIGLQQWDQTIDNWELSLGKPSIRGFIASARMPKVFLQVASGAEPVAPIATAGLTAPAGTSPDVFLVLQESTFLPSTVRPGYEPHTLFAKTPGAVTGPLHVHTFAGATWKTEFTVTTQMRPQEFGSDGLYVFYQLEGRIKESIFTRLKALGYRTMVFYPVPANFINARNFYSSIGVDEFYDPQALGLSSGWDWKASDAEFYNAMLKKIGDSDKPVVAMMLTINQHGPHDYEDPIADYVARFAQSDDAYRDFLAALAKRGRKAGVVTFGDHQPEFMANREERPLWYFTAYDIRCVNFSCADTTVPDRGAKTLDAVMLAPLALEKFGFKLDDFSAHERSLFGDCDDDVSRCSDVARLGVNAAFSKFFN